MNPPVPGAYQFPKNATTLTIGLDPDIDQGQDIVEPANPDTGTPYEGGGTVVYSAAPTELVMTFINCGTTPILTITVSIDGTSYQAQQVGSSQQWNLPVPAAMRALLPGMGNRPGNPDGFSVQYTVNSPPMIRTIDPRIIVNPSGGPPADAEPRPS